jgi:hypothetical protein
MSHFATLLVGFVIGVLCEHYYKKPAKKNNEKREECNSVDLMV